MSEDTTKCNICGADLEGSDVYEGLCRKCREDKILGNRPPSRKPARRAPPPAATPSAAPAATRPQAPAGAIAIETDVDTDADTREMILLKEAAAQQAAPQAPPPAGPSEAAAARPAAPTRAFDGILDLEETPQAPPAAAEPAEPPAEVSLPLAPPRAAEPLKAEPPPAPEHSPVPEPPILTLRRSAAHPDLWAAEPAAPPPPEPSQPTPRVADRPTPPIPLQSAPESEEPVVLSARSDEHEPKIRLVDEPPLQPRVERAGDLGELRALVQRLTHDVEEVSARLRGSAGLAMTPGQQFGFGFRAFFGFLMGAALFALAGIGILGLAGLLFHPPALALLKRLLSPILGTP